MNGRARLVAMLLASACVLDASLASAAAVTPMRTLVYDLHMEIDNARLEHNSGFDPTSSAVGRGHVSYPMASRVSGRVTANVIAASRDGFLVVDVAETASVRNRPTVRVTVARNGDLIFDPKQNENLTVEEIALLRWLARGFADDLPPSTGAGWDIPQAHTGTTGAEHYRVLAIDGARFKLDYKMEVRRTGAQGYDATRLGSLTYDTAYSVPTEVAYQEVAHQELRGNIDTTSTSVELRLLSDSFIAASPAPH